MDFLLDALPDILKYSPAVAVLVWQVYLFTSGRIMSRQTMVDLRSGDKENQKQLEELYQAGKEELVILFKQLIAEKDKRLATLEERFREREHLASLGLQYMVASQQSQDGAAQLIASMEALLKNSRPEDGEYGED